MTAINFDTQPVSTEPVEMTDLFTLNGKTYRIPAKPRVNVALKFLRLMREKNELEAAAMLLPDMVGVEAFNALTEYEGLTDEMLAQVCQAAAKVTMGGLDKALGNSGSGPHK